MIQDRAIAETPVPGTHVSGSGHREHGADVTADAAA
jgi:hypothetical protein